MEKRANAVCLGSQGVWVGGAVGASASILVDLDHGQSPGKISAAILRKNDVTSFKYCQILPGKTLIIQKNYGNFSWNFPDNLDSTTNTFL